MLTIAPVPALLSHIRAASQDFSASAPVRLTRAPGRLDVMGGIADYTGSLVCEMTLDRAAAVASQARDDRDVCVTSFNLNATHRVSLDTLAADAVPTFDARHRWAAYLVGCLYVLHQRKLVDLKDPRHAGISLAVYSTVPIGAGVASSAAITVATMLNLIHHFGVQPTPLQLADMCQEVEQRIVGAPCGIMDQVTTCLGEAGTLLRMICQPHELQPSLRLPEGVRVIGIDTGVKHSVAGGQYARTRCAAFMGHRIILDRMRDIGAAAGREMVGDPMRGYLANLDPDDYKRMFRNVVPEQLTGQAFLDRHGSTIDTATTVDPAATYSVQRAVDHHVLEARRVRRFVEYLEQANSLSSAQARERGAALDRAGHLMYASHISYTNDALLGAPECDLLVDLVRKRERAGLYGAKITGGGSGGTVAVLCDMTTPASDAVNEIVAEYVAKTGNKAATFEGTSAGAWVTGSVVAPLA